MINQRRFQDSFKSSNVVLGMQQLLMKSVIIANTNVTDGKKLQFCEEKLIMIIMVIMMIIIISLTSSS